MSLDLFYLLMQIVLIILVPGSFFLLLNQGWELLNKFKGRK